MTASIPHGGSRAGAIFRVTSGNFLEQFDFFLFGFYATQIAAVFFPASSEFASLMMTFAVFGAGFLMRPLGAIVLGAYIDDVGRRKGLIVTLSIMASGTLLIVLVPGYASIGLWAPALVLLGRLLQGFSAGAELGGVSVYLAEMATPGRKGFYTSWQSGSQQISIVVAAALIFVGYKLASFRGLPNVVVVLTVLAISAYMTLKGLFGQWRASYLDPVSVDLSQWGLSAQGLPQVLARLTGLPDKTVLLITLSVVGLGLLAFVFKDKRFRANPSHVFGSVVLGLVVVAAWYLTGHLGYGEDPETLETVYFATNTRTLESMSFVAPVAYNLEMLMMWTDKSLRMTFGIASAIGVVLGSFAYAISTRQFRWEGFASMEDLRTQLIGAVLMGFGGVTAMGCTIGQGLSGVSTLAIGSFIALTGIVGGAVATMKWQQR